MDHLMRRSLSMGKASKSCRLREKISGGDTTRLGFNGGLDHLSHPL